MPIIDRDFPSDRLGRDRKHSSKVLVLATILIAVLVLGATAGLIGQIGNSKEPLPSETPARITYTTHSPISIFGNGGFTNASGVIWGSGAASDPYIIGGWDIDASSSTGIYIVDTNTHFIIWNCYIHDAVHFLGGIYLGNCANGTLNNNVCSNNNNGIFLTDSNGNTLINNSCSNGDCGIRISGSSDCTLSNNSCSNTNVGMRIEFSSNNNTLTDNNCSNNGIGVCLEYTSENNTLDRNTCWSNTGFGLSVTYTDSINNKIWNNTFYRNNGAGDTYDLGHVQASDSGAGNWWNSTDGYGNWWSDWQSPDTVPPYGIVDLPYNISGSAGAKDYYPLTTTPTKPIPEFGMMPLVTLVLLAAILLTICARRRMAE